VHYIHHLHSTRHNYAVLNVGLDWLVGSFVLEEALKEEKENSSDGEEADNALSNIDIAGLGSLATITLGMQTVQRNQKRQEWAWSRGVVSIALRLFIVLLMVAMWKEAQSCIVSSPLPVDVSDWGHNFVPLSSNPHHTQKNLLFIQDVVAFTLFAYSIVGPSVRPLVALFYSFTIRELLVAMGGEVAPASSVWEISSKPSYGFGTQTNEQSISGLIILFTICAFEFNYGAGKRKYLGLLAFSSIGWAAYNLLSLRAVWT